MFRVSSLAVAMIMVGTLLVPRARADEFSVASLQGSYAYTVSVQSGFAHGVAVGWGSFTIQGVLTFDGSGNVTSAVRVWNYDHFVSPSGSGSRNYIADSCRADGGTGTYTVGPEGLGEIHLHWPTPFCGRPLLSGPAYMNVSSDEDMRFVIADGQLQLQDHLLATAPDTSSYNMLSVSMSSEWGIAVRQSSPCTDTTARVDLRPLPALPR